jgi:hypothetical protein
LALTRAAVAAFEESCYRTRKCISHQREATANEMTLLSRFEVVQSFLDLFECPAFLEIAVFQSDTFDRVAAPIKVLVDQNSVCEATNRIENLQKTRVFRLTSDQYFYENTHEQNKFDVIYIDGLHTFEQSLRDLLNSIACLNPNGVIIIDDIIPNSYVASLPDLALVSRLRTQMGMQDVSWMGDVFKLVFLIQSSFQQYSYATVQENRGQLVLWPERRRASELVDRKIEHISRLEYSAVIEHEKLFNIRPCAEIVASVKANAGGNQNLSEKTFWTNKLVPEAAAIEECAQAAAGWTDFLELEKGCKTIAAATRYALTPFLYQNRNELTQDAVNILSTYDTLKTVDVSPITLYAFEDVKILPHGVLLVNGKLIRETLAPVPPDFIGHVDEYLSGYHQRLQNSVYEVETDRPVLVLEQPGLFNYGHWLVEMFPKIFPVLEYIRRGEVAIYLPEHFRNSTIISQTLSHAGVDQSNIYWCNIYQDHPDKLTQLKHVLYISPISKHLGRPGYVSPWSANVLNRLTSDITAGSQRKLFISRRDAQQRYLLNEGEVYATLEPLGYVNVRAGEMSFREQVSIFKGATEIVGVFGASLTNIIFCQYGTKLLNISANNAFDHFYFDLASLRDLAYWHLNAVVERGQEHQLYCDFRVDMKTFFDVFNKFASANPGLSTV